MSVLSLFDMLYPEKEPLPVPDCTKTYATRQVRNLKFQIYFQIFLLKSIFKIGFCIIKIKFIKKYPDGPNVHLDSLGEESEIRSYQLTPGCAKLTKETP